MFHHSRIKNYKKHTPWRIHSALIEKRRTRLYDQKLVSYRGNLIDKEEDGANKSPVIVDLVTPTTSSFNHSVKNENGSFLLVNCTPIRDSTPIEIICNSTRSALFIEKFCSGVKGKCICTIIEVEGSNALTEKWMTPVEFVFHCVGDPKLAALNWAELIFKIEGMVSLQSLINSGVIKCHCFSCTCEQCKFGSLNLFEEKINNSSRNNENSIDYIDDVEIISASNLTKLVTDIVPPIDQISNEGGDHIDSSSPTSQSTFLPMTAQEFYTTHIYNNKENTIKCINYLLAKHTWAELFNFYYLLSNLSSNNKN